MSQIALLALVAAGNGAGALPEWDFTTGEDYGWRINDSLRPVKLTDEGLVTALEGTDPWMIGPEIEVQADRARYVYMRMRVGHHGGGSVYFATDDAPEFAQERMARFRLNPGGRWQELLVDMEQCDGWKGTITQLRLDPIDVWPNIPDSQPIAISRIALLPASAKPAQVMLKSFRAGSSWLVRRGTTVRVEAVVGNAGGRPAKIGPPELRLPEFCEIVLSGEPHSEVPAEGEVRFEWFVRADEPGAGSIDLTIPVEDGEALVCARRLFAHSGWPPPAGMHLRKGRARISAATSPVWGYGTLFLQVQSRSDEWETIGVMPSLGSVAAEGPDGGIEMIELVGADEPRMTATEGREGLALATWRKDSEGRRWEARLAIEAGETELPLFRTELAVTCDSSCVVRRIDGPSIMAGYPAAVREGALFGGVEWLESSERSWSRAVDRSDLRIRYRPHVNRIAVPAMAMACSGGWAGWLWRPGDDPPGAVFGAPVEEVTGRDDSIMGLYRPGVRSNEAENSEFGMKPMQIGADEQVTIRADLLLGGPEADVSDACRIWAERFGLPKPMAPPEGDYRKQLAFTMRAFTGPLWEEEQVGWYNGLGPARDVGRFGPFMGSVLMGDRWLSGDIARECGDRLARTAGPPESYRGKTLPWYEGSLIATFGRRLGGYATTIERQNEDGGWTFADWLNMRHMEGRAEDLYELGAPQRSEIGFGAGQATGLLRMARVTGDPKARAAGLKALEWMDTFTVPRAAQCWEVPAHAPDIVAAAQAVRAFVEGYRLTGAERYRNRAEVWARRGMPFIYLWNDRDLPAMRYASTPVIGATRYQGFWYGRPVQWCGLDFAQALDHLVDAGAAEPWATLRDGLLSSGLQQQFTEPHRIGLIPDSIDLTRGGLAADYWVAPYRIALLLAQQLGSLPAPHTDRAGEIRVSAMGEVVAAIDEGALTIRVRFPDEGPHHVLVAGIGDLDGVTIDGRALAESDELGESDGWTAARELGLVEIRVESAREATLVVEGVEVKAVELL